MKKLQSHTDYEDSIDLPSVSDSEFRKLSRNHRKFINQPLTLGMLVPCDLDGEILYRQYVGGKEVIYDKFVQDDMMDKVKEYQKAKERVFFDGFEVDVNVSKDSPWMYVTFGFKIHKESKLFYDYTTELKTIEDLVKYNLTLTPQAIKQLGL